MKKLILILTLLYSYLAFGQKNSTVISVTIGTQVWMTKNLDVNTFQNGDTIPEAKSDSEWVLAGERGKPAWCYYKNHLSNGRRYGKLYNWFAVNDARGLAPKGWRIPSDSEWCILTNYLGGDSVAAYKMKCLEQWNNDGDNSSGFYGFLGGYRNQMGQFLHGGNSIGYWTCTLRKNEPIDRFLIFGYREVYKYPYYKEAGLSVRCVKN